MADNETIADLIAWLRKPREGENAYLTLWRDEIADRLEAAHRRERGDCAKLREALLECAQYIVCVGGIGVGEVTINDNWHLIPEVLAQKAVTALATPPRNCDRPECATTKAAQDMWRREDGGKTAYYEWLLAPATEGGAR